MPIKLIAPQEGRSPYFYGRGAHLGRFVSRSTKVHKRTLARKIIKQWERDIESGVFADKGAPTFLSAAISYMQAGGERTYIQRIADHFGNTPLRELDQAAIDNAAATLYPYASPATRNRGVYTPVSAVLRHAGHRIDLRRPKGAQGQRLLGWFEQEKAFALLDAAVEIDVEFGAYLYVLLYTGCRLSEPLNATCDDVEFSQGKDGKLQGDLFIRTTKNGEPRRAFLPHAAAMALANHPRGLNRPGERLFRFHKGGALYGFLKDAAANAGVTFPPGQKFHTFCHTFATWLRKYAKADIDTLLGTRRWKSRQSAERYMHMDLTEESQRAALLPAPKVRIG